MKYAGPTGDPVFATSSVAASGAMPLKIEKARLNDTATPLKRMRVGNRSAATPLIGPLTSDAASPASANSGISPMV
jgi:hypothetical protein